MKKQLLYTFFVLISISIQAQQKSLLDYFLQEKVTELSASVAPEKNNINYFDTVSDENTRRLHSDFLKLEKRINYLSETIDDLNDEKREQLRKKYFASITSLGYMNMEIQKINENLSVLKYSIQIINDRNIVNSPEFKTWLDSYNQFLAKESGSKFSIDISSINTNSIYDFIFSAITSIFSNNNAKKDLQNKSLVLTNLLQENNNFYKTFQYNVVDKHTQVNKVVVEFSANYDKLKIKYGGQIPTESQYINPESAYNSWETINNKFSSLNKQDIDNTIYDSYQLIEKYKVMKIEYDELMLSYKKITDISEIKLDPVKNNTYPVFDIESEIEKILSILIFS